METTETTNDTVNCHLCGDEITSADAHELGGETFCSTCAGRAEVCSQCEGVDYTDDGIYDHNGDFHCEGCAEDLAACEDCNEYYPADDLNTVYCGSMRSEKRVCDACRRDYHRCEDCGDYTDTDHGDNDTTLCLRCYEDNGWFRCESCEGLFGDSDYGGDGLCNECYDDRENEEEDSGASVHDYGYRPLPRYHRADGEEHTTTTLYFGIELEVERNGKEVPDLEDGYRYLKHDGSLANGFEVVSHPATWQWLQQNKAAWEEVLDLRKEGYRSYDTTTCGMHVHLSRKAFSAFHLFKWLHFFYGNPQFILDISRRKPGSLARWASLDGPHDSAELILKAKGDKRSQNRYEAINLTNAKTVEIRIFRGTLAPQGFWRNVEFLQALYLYTAGISAVRMKSLSVTGFRAFVALHAADYPAIHAWLTSSDHNTFDEE